MDGNIEIKNALNIVAFIKISKNKKLTCIYIIRRGGGGERERDLFLALVFILEHFNVFVSV